MMAKAKEIWNHESKALMWISPIAVFLVCIIYSHFCGITEYPYDSLYYWTIADPVRENGGIDLMLYPETFRGCLLPLTILAFKVIFRGIWGWRILSALIVTSLFGVTLPIFISGKLDDTFGRLLRTIIAVFFFIYVWGDYIQYPLSDLASTAALMVAICLCKSILEGANIENAVVGNSIKGLALGAFLYASYNIRTTFMYGAFIIVGISIVKMIRRPKLLIEMILPVIIGAFLAAIPQCIINNNYLDTFSPKVYTEQSTDYNRNLTTTQVLWGFYIQRYETYIGSLEAYPSEPVVFNDPVGYELAGRAQLLPDSFSLTDVLRLTARNPLDMIGMYTRHLITLMTPAWRQIYISNIRLNSDLLVILSIVVWLLGGLELIRISTTKRLNWVDVGLCISAIIPGLLQMAGAPELRFFISAYVLLYALVFMKANYVGLIGFYRNRLIPTVFICAFIAIIWISLFATTLINNRERPILINDTLKIEETTE